MSGEVSELRAIYEELLSFVAKFNTPELLKPINALEEQATEVGKAWSGSWLGYQSCVYYSELKPPPPGANFSSEWGLHTSSAHSFQIRASGWVQFDEDVIKAEIRKRAGNPETARAEELANEGRELFERKHGDVVSILQTAKTAHTDPFLDKLLKETETIQPATPAQIIGGVTPSGRVMSRDSLAIHQGFRTPPHICVWAEVQAMKQPAAACELLGKVVRQAFSHLERMGKNRQRQNVSEPTCSSAMVVRRNGRI
jgi:hypothetical protein